MRCFRGEERVQWAGSKTSWHKLFYNFAVDYIQAHPDTTRLGNTLAQPCAQLQTKGPTLGPTDNGDSNVASSNLNSLHCIHL